jgi:hypothetical protein
LFCGTAEALPFQNVFMQPALVSTKAADDFDGDACLIIRDEDEFARRMLKAFYLVNPHWQGTFKNVDHIDPCAPKSPPDVYFTKHFRYAYQEEKRFVWIPPRPLSISEFPPVTINLGPLSDICDLLVLGPRPPKSAGK